MQTHFSSHPYKKLTQTRANGSLEIEYFIQIKKKKQTETFNRNATAVPAEVNCYFTPHFIISMI